MTRPPHGDDADELDGASPTSDPADLVRRARAVGKRARRIGTDLDRDLAVPMPRGLRDPMTVLRDGLLDPRSEPVAVVFAGGGARGAYQAGALTYLAEARVPVRALSGASIGSLNGAVVASAPTIKAGADRLLQVWRGVAQKSGAAPFGRDSVTDPSHIHLANLAHHMSGPMLRPNFLDELVAQHIDADSLRDGLPMYVSVFPAVNPDVGAHHYTRLLSLITHKVDGPLRTIGPRFGWAVDFVRVALRIKSEWWLINDMPPKRMRQAVLGSAALPVVTPPRSVGGRVVRDGGMGDNVPLTPLATRTGCARVVVIHLNPLALFNPGEFPGVDVIEIMPSSAVAGKGVTGWWTSLVDLSPKRVEALAELGYADARDTLERRWRKELQHQVTEQMETFRRDAVAELDEPR